MTEQIVEGVISAEVDTRNRTIVPKGALGAETAATPSEPVNVLWKASGQGHLVGDRPKTLAERVGEAYNYELKPEEKGLLDRAAGQFGRRLSNKN